MKFDEYAPGIKRDGDKGLVYRGDISCDTGLDICGGDTYSIATKKPGKPFSALKLKAKFAMAHWS